MRVPNMCGKDVEKDGAAWMAGKLILPMLSSFVSPKIARMLLNVTHLRTKRLSEAHATVSRTQRAACDFCSLLASA